MWRLRNIKLVLCSALLSSFILAQCSPTPAPVATEVAPPLSQTDTSQSAIQPTSTSAEPISEPSPTAGDVPDDTSLTIGFNVSYTTLDPQSLTNIPLSSTALHIFEPLVMRDDSMEYVPVLAESWERVGDIIWRFHLREGVTFHNGEPFDAGDVVYTMERIKDESLEWVAPTSRNFAREIDHAEIVDDFTVDLVTTEPTAFLHASLPHLPILPEEYGKSTGADFGTDPIGTGPYRFVELVPGERVVLERFDDYWGDAPQVKTLNFRSLVEDSTRVAALEAREVDAINAVPIDALDRLESNPDITVASTPSHRTIGLIMRTQRPPLDNDLVRQAIAHAIDREAIVDELFAGTASVANSPFAPIIFGAATDLPEIEYDPDLARQLLADAGYPDGIQLKYGIPVGNYLMDQQVGEAIAGMLQDVGIDVSGYEIQEWGSFFPSAVNEGNYDIYLYGLGSVDPSFLIFFQALPLYHDWAPEEVPDLLTEIKAGPPEESLAPLHELQELLWNEYPWVFLYYQPQIIAYKSEAEGFAPRTDEYLLFINAEVQ